MKYKRKKSTCKGCKALVWRTQAGLCYNCFNKIPKTYKTKKPIKKVSDKMMVAHDAYKRAKAEYLEKVPCCEIRLPGCSGCDPRMITLHHKKGRDGDLLTNQDFFCTSCIFCHDRIHGIDTKWAYENGFLISKHQI